MRVDRVTSGELAILEVLWDRPGAGSREITAAIHKEVTDPKMASVQKLIERLESKGCVGRDRSQRAHRFTALVDRDEFLRTRMQALADRLCDGTLSGLVTALVRAKGLSRKDRAQLRQLINREWPTKEKKPTGRPRKG